MIVETFFNVFQLLKKYKYNCECIELLLLYDIIILACQ